jgi:hypothetical protein
MPEKLPVFTEEQLETMQESKHVITALDEATRDYIITYDPEKDDTGHPNLVSMDKIWAKMKMANRMVKVESQAASWVATFTRSYREPSPDRPKDGPRRFGEDWRAFQEPEFAPYRELDVQHEGIITIDAPDLRRNQHYTIYSVHRPDTLLHGLGLITFSTEEFRQEIISIEGSGLGEIAKEAGRRLRQVAAHDPDEERAAEFEEVADNSTGQEKMISEGWFSIDGYHILDGAGAVGLVQTVRYAMEHGVDFER